MSAVTASRAESLGVLGVLDLPPEFVADRSTPCSTTSGRRHQTGCPDEGHLAPCGRLRAYRGAPVVVDP